MILSRYNLKKIDAPGAALPGEGVFELPEKVLQFGTGVLLRGLPDYFIDKANREGVFNGRVVVVKSTDVGSATDFDKQDCLYTLHIKGIENGAAVDEQIVCSAISRVISAADDWAEVLKIAHNPQLKVIISNTTENGITLVQDNVEKYPPVSFPGKLLAVLYERYKAFEGNVKNGLIIIPTELITDNGKKLESIVLELAHLNKLEPAFMDWLENCNHFCNSLVDRIVPGKPGAELAKKLEKQTGYTDNLRTVAEVYCLWAIEGGEEVKNVLSFEKADPGIVITPDIEKYRELKLRLLNGTHTLSCALAFLSGFKTVTEEMNNDSFRQFVVRLMKDEITPAMPYKVSDDEAKNFANRVIDRFINPNIEHQWISISAYYSLKLKMRVLPILLNHYSTNDTVPQYMAIGFAAFIRFMKVIKGGDGKFTGEINGQVYQVSDSEAGKFRRAWERPDINTTVDAVLKDISIWDTDLTKLNGFKAAVAAHLELIIDHGALDVLEQSVLSA